MRLIDSDALKQHYAWWGDTESGKKDKELFDTIVDLQPMVGDVWINTKNAYPENDSAVLAYNRYDGIQFAVFNGYHGPVFLANGAEMDFVTHWMPLPAPPEVE